jgi:hypothetical protein
MDEMNEESAETPNPLSDSVIKKIHKTMSDEYSRKIADLCSHGKGLCMDLETFMELREYMANISAMVRLVHHVAHIRSENDIFNRDVHTAMYFASEKLFEADQLIEEHAPEEKWIDEFIQKEGKQECVFLRDKKRVHAKKSA